MVTDTIRGSRVFDSKSLERAITRKVWICERHFSVKGKEYKMSHFMRGEKSFIQSCINIS